MGGIISDNVGRSSGLIKSAAAPAGIVLVESGYMSSSPGSGGYTTWASRGTGGMGGSYGEWGGALAGSSESITWGSTIQFPSTGVYTIWFNARATAASSSSDRPQLVVDDGSYAASTGFFFSEGPYNVSGKSVCSGGFGYTVDNVSNDYLRLYKMGNCSFNTGQQNGSSMIICKFE